MTFFKLFTHDFCSPLQGGRPIWNGSLPFTLPTVDLDTSSEECAAGWNFVDDLAKGFKIAGMWPTGRPSQVAIIEPSKDMIQRGDKWRASSGTIKRFARQSEIAKAVEEFSKLFGARSSDMANQQLIWRYALGRPESDEKTVVEALEESLAARGLAWKLKRYETMRAARDAWAARDALTVFYAAKKGWIEHKPELLTIGIRDAYANGLEIAIPTEKNMLGYAMADKGKH